MLFAMSCVSFIIIIINIVQLNSNLVLLYILLVWEQSVVVKSTHYDDIIESD